jgi:phosphoglycerol transferase
MKPNGEPRPALETQLRLHEGHTSMEWTKKTRPSVAKQDIWIAMLAGTCALLSWCAANGKWARDAWAYPTAYLGDPERSDFFSNACQIKASGNWFALPFFWKTIPDLGAPYSANWNDFPMPDEIVMGIQAILAGCFGLFAGLNASFALAHVLAAVAFYAAARALACNPTWAFVGALAFGVSPFIFAQSPHHMQVAYAWPVALFPIVWRWAATPHALQFGTWRFWVAIAIAFVTGVHFVYYTNVFCQLTLLGAMVVAFRERSLRALKPAFAIVGTAAAAFAMMNIDSWTYQAVHGRNPGAFVREYKWLEIYGLKIVDLFIPPVTHRSDAFAAFSAAHRQAAPLLDEGGSYLGIVGLAALAFLIGTAVLACLERRERDVPMEAWQLLWILLMFTTGGLNALLGSFGITMFRAACRYSIVILAIALLYAAQRLTAWQEEAEAGPDAAGKSLSFKAAAVVLCGLILWDQVPRAPTAAQTAEIARQVDADREFVATMEKTLAPGAMVFQLPVMEFPESPIPGVPPYDHFRPYLYSKQLRFSFGSMKGREREKWQQQLQNLLVARATPDQEAQKIRFNADNARRAVDELKKLGFAAVYINRNGFPDRAKGLEEALLELGYDKPPIRNATGDLVCILLEK